MLLSLVVIYLPNLFSCQKSLSDSHLYGTTSRPQAARAFLLKVQPPLTVEAQPQADIACYISKLPIEKLGGAERDRTVDPLLAKQVLSQLSYSPLLFSQQR